MEQRPVAPSPQSAHQSTESWLQTCEQAQLNQQGSLVNPQLTADV